VCAHDEFTFTCSGNFGLDDAKITLLDGAVRARRKQHLHIFHSELQFLEEEFCG
jgi:hypothetical protein